MMADKIAALIEKLNDDSDKVVIETLKKLGSITDVLAFEAVEDVLWRNADYSQEIRDLALEIMEQIRTNLHNQKV